NYSYLRENMELNAIKNISLHQVAVGDSQGEVWLTLDDTYSRVLDDKQANTVRVAMTPLDDLIGEQQFAVFKLDVEGVELSVLQGARQSLMAGRLPVILFELNGSSRRYGLEDEAIIEFLSSQGYS